MASVGPSRAVKTFKVAATVSAYRIVSFDTVTSSDYGFVRVIQIPTESSHILGISQDTADTTSAQFQAIPVLSYGYAKVAAGQSVSAGSLLTFVTTTGYAIEGGTSGTYLTATFSTTPSLAIPKLIGVALQKASLSDAVIECMVNINNIRVRI